MLETTEVNSRSTLQVALGFLLGILACVGCFFVSILLAGVLGLRDPWMFVLLNAAALVTTGLMALRNIHKSSYPDGALIAISVAFLLNLLLLAATLSGSGYVE
jgi:hypothetical protein